MYEWIIIFLIVLIITQNIYWQWICSKLINRVMSRNYGDYLQTQASVKLVKKTPGKTESPEIPEDLGSLFEI